MLELALRSLNQLVVIKIAFPNCSQFENENDLKDTGTSGCRAFVRQENSNLVESLRGANCLQGYIMAGQGEIVS